MTSLRSLLLRHRALSAWIVAFALIVKVLVPAGYMIGQSGGSFALELCSGQAAGEPAMAGMSHHSGDPDRSGKSDHPGKDRPCAFSGLSAPSLAAADPILLALAIAFVLATAFRVPVPSVAGARAFLRPPLRGPPLHA